MPKRKPARYDLYMARQMNDVRYIGPPCEKCGGNEFYVKYPKRCTACSDARHKSWKEQNVERFKELRSEWYQRNKELVAERNRTRYIDPVEAYQKRKEYNEKYKLQPKTRKKSERTVFHAGKRRSLVKGTKSLKGFSNSDIETMLILKRKGCVYCEETDKLNLDHKTPLSRGGLHEIENVQWLCQHHNSQKSSKTCEEYETWCLDRGIYLGPKLKET